ncbi:hypothetical protein [Massilia sp. BJB1822]|uniref:hypothetical protein n=1 Tax=Massilia sp. BJB1822 TaxID=2744470 RepID=UPI001593D5CF|nr:hypothetical protein [Massilia sp. BJB1822]NVE00817.1 hypothetical protein [Massilia sp. BJB1822]
MKKLSLLAVLLAAAISACSPKFDWRDFRSNHAPYAVLFPGKPATHTRSVNLDGLEVKMTMAAAEIDGTLFAIGSAEVPDASQAPQAAAAMKTAMVRNIGATITKESANGNAKDVEARGMNKGMPTLLIGRFLFKDKRVYQVVVIGAEKHIEKEAVETFMSSFKLN